MQENIVRYKEKVDGLLDDKFYSHVNKFLDERINYFVSLKNLSHSWSKSVDGILENDDWWAATSEFYDNIENLLQKERYLMANSGFIANLDQFVLATNNLFKVQESDVPSKAELKKDKEVNKTFRDNLLYYHINNRFLESLLTDFEDLLSKIGKQYLECYDLVLEFNNTTLNPELALSQRSVKAITFINEKLLELEESTKLLKSNFPTTISNIFEDLEKYLTNKPDEKFKTEILLEKLSFKEVKKSDIEFDDNWREFKQNFDNYFLALFDTTEFLEDILWFNARLRNEYFLVLKKFFETEKYLEENVFSQLDNLISNSRVKIENSTNENLSLTIGENKSFLLSKITTELIVDFVDHFSIDDFSLKIKSFIEVVENNLSEFCKDYSFIKEEDIVFRLKTKDVTKFSPKELITPIVINRLKQELESITSNINNDLIKLNTDIIAYSDMVEFNLETAESLYNENIELADESRQLAVEGLVRAKLSNEDFTKRFRKVGDQFEKLFINASEKALGNLTDFIDIDKLLSIRIQASKDKVIQNLKDKFWEIFSLIKVFVVKDVKIFLKKYGSFRKKIIALSSRVGLTSEGLGLSEELSKYLLQVSSTLSKLPYIYRKIFENEPVLKEDLFLGRRDEIAKFTWAFRRWNSSIPTSILIVGEKGSGTSSMINIALRRIFSDFVVLRKKLESTVYKSDDLLTELKSLFELPDVNSIDELIESINSYKLGKIVVIENIEDYFLKIVNGFDGIKNLLRIISETNEKIFWIATCNIYTWKYLNATLNINDSFTSVIKLAELSRDDIRDIIMKRHKISGYKLKFSLSDELARNSSFNKKNEEEKQKILGDEFFEKIRELSPNNIAISLFLWLRSISDFKDNEILINTNMHRDFSFLQLLRPQKLHSLAGMIINDGLTVEEHSLIFNVTHNASKSLLMSLEDSGIIFQTKTKYKINFQLYQPIINLLKNKNILH
ncbi:MAG: ATP-binding protein [Bacteroidetes bacterium]|nr:ATP-binding protein [Bacteroidota bacterium]